MDKITLLKELTDIGIALSNEKEHIKLLEMILLKAQALTNADGATLYERTENNELKFSIIVNDSLGIHWGGTSQDKIKLPVLPLYTKTGKPNVRMVVTCAALNRQTIVIDDAYSKYIFDFSGTYKFDKKFGYHSKSFLTVPMTNHLNELIGVLQLINARDKITDEIISFTPLDEQIVQSLSSQAAVTLTNRDLINAQKKLFDSLIQLIARSIDEKSAYTGGHCRRVPVISKMLAEAVSRIDKGPLKEFVFSDDEIYELEVAAWLHDCGKLTTPEYVVDKMSKLETIFDRIHLIDTRFEVLKRDKIIEALNKKLKDATGSRLNIYQDPALEQELKKLDEDRDFIRACNTGSIEVVIDKEKLDKINAIAKQQWLSASGDLEPFLTEDEMENLKIYKGTLNPRERKQINQHVIATEQMLECLPYPKSLSRVPLFASSHHEKMDGTGYPKGIFMSQMPLQSRIIAIADVFEALTASDRPYKKALPLSYSLEILGKMKLEGHIDPDLFDVFMHEKIYMEYAKKYLNEKSIDEITPDKVPGYNPLD